MLLKTTATSGKCWLRGFKNYSRYIWEKKLGTVAHAYNSNTWEVGAEEPHV